MTTDVSYYSSVGGRDNNEDFLAVYKNKNALILVLADGLGGHQLGEVASRITVNTVLAHLKKAPIINKSTIESAVNAANIAVYKRNMESQMKSTLALLCVTEEQAYTATVGDTRIYQFRDSNIIFQSKDHSVAQMAVDVGKIPQYQIRGHHERNNLTRAIGDSITVDIDISCHNVNKGDHFLICSDGFWENIFEKEMCDLIFISKDSKEWLNKMRKHASIRMTADCDNNSAVACIIH